MTEADYQRYVACFNERRYDDLCAFFSPDVVLETLGYAIEGHNGIRAFYGVYHEYVRETVMLNAFVPGAPSSVADATIRFEGLKAMGHTELDAFGYGRMTPVPAGEMVHVNFLIRYRQRDDGLIDHIRCAVYQPAERAA